MKNKFKIGDKVKVYFNKNEDYYKIEKAELPNDTVANYAIQYEGSRGFIFDTLIDKVLTIRKVNFLSHNGEPCYEVNECSQADYIPEFCIKKINGFSMDTE